MIRSRARFPGVTRCGAAAACGLFAVLAASCGLPEQDQAQVIDDVPDDVLAVVSTTSTAVAVEEDDAPFTLTLYWHESDQGRLIQVSRPSDTQPTPLEALQQLREGPTNQEIADTAGVLTFGPSAGLRLTPDELAPVLEGPVDGTLTIRVSGAEFRELPNKANAAAELVCTLTEFDEIDGVTVVDDQPEPITLVGNNAEPIVGPATRANFGDCEPFEVADDGPTPPTTG